MLEYNVETLVHLYDSLNSEIAKTEQEVEKFNQFAADPTDERAMEEITKLYERLLARNIKLNKMRDNVEKLLDNILNIEVGEISNS